MESLVLITMLAVTSLQAYSGGELFFRFVVKDQRELHRRIRASFDMAAGRDLLNIIVLHTA